MHILLATDSYKGCLSAPLVCAALREGLLDAQPGWAVDCLPLGDGGEGTLEVVAQATGAALRRTRVRDPLQRPVEAAWSVLAPGTAYVELAQASGLDRVAPGEREVLRAGTYGTGELLRLALDAGCRELHLGLGGSATVDGGAGLLQALGARLLDVEGRPVGPGGGALSRVARVDLSALHPELTHARVRCWCDVANPLLGPQGAAAVYGPQKGAGPAEVVALEAGLTCWARVLEDATGRRVCHEPGSGAAGGAALPFLALGVGTIERGAAVVLERVGFAARAAAAAVVVTGEGGLDVQTESGKLPWTVRAAALAQGRPVAAVVGRIDPAYRDRAAHCFDPLVELAELAGSGAEAQRDAPHWLRRAGALLAARLRAAALPSG